MTDLFSDRFRRKVGKAFHKRGYEEVPILLEKANSLALKELEYELTVDKTIEQLKELTESTEERKVKELLEGVKDTRNTQHIVSFFKKIKSALRKIKYILYKIGKFNDENVKVLEQLILIIASYKKNHRLSATLKQFELLCRDRYTQRKKIQDLITKLQTPIENMLQLVEEAIKSTYDFDYQLVLERINDQKSALYLIIGEELSIYGIEVNLLRDSAGLEQFRNMAYTYATDRSPEARGTKLIKRNFLLKKLAKVVFLSTVGLHIAGIGASTVSISYPNPFRRVQTHHQQMVQIHAHENITFQSKGGYNLKGWFFNNPNTDKTIILCTGRSVDKSYEMPYVQDFSGKYNVFVFDFRHHGEDSFGTTSIGFHEMQDLIGALDYLASRGIKEVAVMGHSMGGAVAIMTAAQYKSPDIKIKVLITEGAFADLNELIDKKARDVFVPPHIAWPSKRLSEVVSGFKINDVSPEKFVGNIGCPVLFLQGDEDDTAPPDSAKRLFDHASGPKEIEIFHGEHNVPNKAVSELSLRFLEKHF